MLFKKIPLLTICTYLFFSTMSLADVIPLNQDRSVYCFAFAEDDIWSESDGDSASATDFDMFNESVSAPIYIGSVDASGNAYQISIIDPTGFYVYGGCAAEVTGYEYEGYGIAQGRSFFQCEFEIDAPTSFALTGPLASYDDCHTVLSLTGPGLSVFFDPGFNNYLDLNEGGTLEPGIYSFTVLTISDTFGDLDNHGRASGYFDLELAFTSASAAPLPGHDDLTLQLSPNPFSHQTEIAFSVPSRRTSSLKIFDMRGRLVRRLLIDGRKSGSQSWDGKNNRGQAVATGTYFVLLKSGNEVRLEKAILVR